MFDISYFEGIDDGNRARFAEAIKSADGLLGASVKLTAEMLAPAARLRVISTISVGIDQFDVDYLSSRGIVLVNTPDVLTETTADTIFSLILSSARRVVELAEFVKAGNWTHSIGEAHYGSNVHAKTIGVLGMGRIGRAVARRASLGFGMQVLYTNAEAVPEADSAFGARLVPLDTLLAEADFVCVVLPLTPETERMIGAREFALMRPSAIFINGSRGRIVDEAALIDALQGGRIHGAGLDVFEREPLSPASPLLQMRNVVALPHIGSATHETRFAMAQLAVDNLVAVLEGKRPRCQVN
jgi:phosphogluconate 2-dehydrogenase/gluconate 2-dehydrogenase